MLYISIPKYRPLPPPLYDHTTLSTLDFCQVKRVKRTAKASSPSKVPCSMCSCTFANRQGLGMHTKAMHGDGQAREGVRLKGMPGNGGGRAVLPWDTAGPGRCWTVQFNHPAPGSSYSSAPNSAAKFVLKRKGLVKTELEEGLVTPDRAKQTRGASTRKRYTFRQKASVISNLRMLEGLSKEIWASDKLTPQQLLEAQTKIHHSLISKWAKDEENIVLRAGQEGAAALLEEVRTGMEASS